MLPSVHDEYSVRTSFFKLVKRLVDKRNLQVTGFVRCIKSFTLREVSYGLSRIYLPNSLDIGKNEFQEQV